LVKSSDSLHRSVAKGEKKKELSELLYNQDGKKSPICGDVLQRGEEGERRTKVIHASLSGFILKRNSNFLLVFGRGKRCIVTRSSTTSMAKKERKGGRED